MLWQLTLSPLTMASLVSLAVAAMAASFVWSRKQLDPRRPAAILTIALRIVAFMLLLFLALQPARLPEPKMVAAQRTMVVLVDVSGSMSTSDGAKEDGVSRLDRARRWIKQYRIFEQIKGHAKMALFVFDSQAMPVKSEALDALESAGRRTALASSIEQALKQHEHDDVAGVLLFTDGRHTEGDNPLRVVAERKIPLYPVAVGRRAPQDQEKVVPKQHDLAVDSVVRPPRAILGHTVQVNVAVRAVGYDARQVTVQLIRKDSVLATTKVAVDPQRNQRMALFTVRPDYLGTNEYEVRIEPEAGEADPDNNRAIFSIDVVDPINRVLYLDRLRFERRFLKPILAALRNLRYTAIVPRDKDRILVQGNDEQMKREAATLSPEQMWGLKAMIIGDIPATSLDADQINALVRWVDEGGSLLFLAGPQSMGQSGFGATPLADLLPVSVGANAAYIEGEIRVRLTPLGAAHPAFQRVQSQWDRAAPLLSRFNVQSVLPAATVLFSTASEPAAPIVVSRRYGHGKVTIVLTDSTWRWQLAHGTGERGRSARGEHALFWEQLIDWLLPDLSEDAPDEHQVQLITDRLTYEINDVVTLMAGVQSADGSVVPDARVLFSIAAANGRTIKRSGILQEQAGQIAETVYVAEFDVLAEGSYEIRVMATHQGKILGTDQTTICVIHPLIEFANTDPDHELLNELADLSEGQVLDPQDLANLSDIISLSPREVWVQPHAEADAEPVWDRWWILTVFIALMTTEWTVRRMNQWV